MSPRLAKIAESSTIKVRNINQIEIENFSVFQGSVLPCFKFGAHTPPENPKPKKNNKETVRENNKKRIKSFNLSSIFFISSRSN